MVEVNYELTPDDLRQGVVACQANSRLGRLRRWVYVILGILLPVMLVAAWNSSNEKVLVVVVVLGCLGWLFVGMNFWIPYLLARRRFTGSSLGLGTVFLEASDDGLRIKTNHSNSLVSWPTYLGWCENKYVIVLLGSSLISMVVPKRAFLPTQLSDFLTLLKQKLPGSPKS